jgi:hypothetical protein
MALLLPLLSLRRIACATAAFKPFDPVSFNVYNLTRPLHCAAFSEHCSHFAVSHGTCQGKFAAQARALTSTFLGYRHPFLPWMHQRYLLEPLFKINKRFLAFFDIIYGELDS